MPAEVVPRDPVEERKLNDNTCLFTIMLLVHYDIVLGLLANPCYDECAFKRVFTGQDFLKKKNQSPTQSYVRRSPRDGRPATGEPKGPTHDLVLSNLAYLEGM